MSYYDYKGKKVYMGIDVHKKTYVCVSVSEGAVVKKDSMAAKPEALIAYCKNNFLNAELETAYEAGFSGFHLHRELTTVGIKNIVVNAGSIETASRDRVKTDKRDAKKIAVQLAAGRLNCIYIPTLEQEAKRSTTRLRDSFVNLRHQVGQKLKALLFTQGLIEDTDNTVLSKSWVNTTIKKVQKLNYPTGFYYTVKRYADQWLTFNDELNKIKIELLAMQTEEENKLLLIYKSVPGIGDITALKLKDELGDMSQFPNEKKLFNYLGMTPTEYSSGENVRHGNISRQGRSALRHILIESAWIAIKKDPNLMKIYTHIKNTRGAKKAIVGVARRLAGRIRTCLKLKINYKIQSLEIKDRKDANNIIELKISA